MARTPDRTCVKCGKLVKGNEYGSQVYFPCRECNDEFWAKWGSVAKNLAILQNQ
jgi:hypothetical protein